ncbi:MAG: hypothetical protein ATN31_05500 [Candidatus Epulonipiscioides saccharophilum]|nr:MAG: hypothetical protein ATN31_05500 [Epulopiscium sp. AS2M-Bin001]
MRKLLYLLFIIIPLVGCWSKNNSDDNINSNMIFTNENQVQSDLLLYDLVHSDDKIVLTSDIPLTLNPIINSDADVAQMLNLVFDTLVNIEPDGSVTPNLAKYYTVNESDNSVTLVLDENVLWHDGTPISADDVIYSIHLLKESKNSFYYVNAQNISYVTSLSPNTVKIFYTVPFSGVLQTLFFPIIPEHIYEKHSNPIPPVGSGPYKYLEEISQKELNLIRNPDYFNGSPIIEYIDIYYTPNHMAALSAFDLGLIDAIYTEIMNWGKYEKVANIHEVFTNKYEFIGMNFNNKVLNDYKVRQVLNYALNKQQLINIYYLGKGTVSETPISPNSYLYTQHDTTLDKDFIAALLIQAGYTPDNPLKLRMLINEDNIERALFAEGLINMYAQHGIIIIPEYVDANTFNRRVLDGEFELFLGGYKFSYVPDLSFLLHSNSDNLVNYKNQEMDILLDRAFTSNPDDMVSAYNHLQEYFIAQFPYISLFFKSGALITSDRIHGVLSPAPLNIYKDIELWYIK